MRLLSSWHAELGSGVERTEERVGLAGGGGVGEAVGAGVGEGAGGEAGDGAADMIVSNGFAVDDYLAPSPFHSPLSERVVVFTILSYMII